MPSVRPRVLTAIFLLLASPILVPAQEAAHPSLADLAKHREQWPAQVTLKVDVPMNIMSNGQKAGSMTASAGATVDVVSISDTAIQIKVVSATASVSPDQTDLWDRVAALSPKTSTTALTPTAPAPALPPAPAPTPVPPSSPTSPSPAQTDSGPPIKLDYEVAPQNNFTKAAFRFWSPAYKDPIRGLIVLVPGLNGDGRNMLNSGSWQALARKYRLALVACFMQGPDYHNATRGTGDALLEAIQNFADKSGHAEVAQVPLLLYGESAGGQFDYDFTLWKPERVMAFVVNKGGFYIPDEPDNHALSTPGLFFLGKKDTDERINAITSIWTNGRKMGALWALAPQPNSGHEFSRTAPVAQAFFDGVLKARLPDDSLAPGDSPSMKPMEENQGWTGDLTTFEIHDASTDSEPNHNASWFPDQNSATVWKVFVSH